MAKDAGKWTQQSSRYQFTAGAKYNYSKLGVGVNLYYLGDREDASYGSLHKLKNVIKLNSVINYDPDKNNSITLNLYNLLDRDNSINVSEIWTNRSTGLCPTNIASKLLDSPQGGA